MADQDYTHAEHTYIVGTITTEPIITARYTLPEGLREELGQLSSPLEEDPYRYTVYLRTYSRLTADGKREQWIDTVCRVIQGLMSSYVDHMIKHGLRIDLEWVNSKAIEMSKSLFLMQWSPPGRGLFGMGTDLVYNSGNGSLNNCYACSTKDLIKAISWTSNMLLVGGGVGFDCAWGKDASTEDIIRRPNKDDPFTFVIPDSREGWTAGLEVLVRAYIPIDAKITNKFPIFDYSKVRPYGAPIRTFGGTASGPEPLRVLLVRVEIFLDTYIAYQAASTKEEQADVYEHLVRRQHAADAYAFREYDVEEVVAQVRQTVFDHDKPYNTTRLVVDLFNAVGCCVVSGGVRRSSLIALADAGDAVFMDLKNLTINPERESILFLSNNTVRFSRNEDFETYLPEIADRIRQNGEPGVFNLLSAQRFGRITDERYGPDKGFLLNPCGEIILENWEPCCLSVVSPYNCRLDMNDPKSPIDMEAVMLACEHATFYATVVTTIRHHWPESNEVIARNRRIGVGFTGVANIYDTKGAAYLIALQRKMYYKIREVNGKLTSKLGIPRSIRVTTIKPDGTLSIVLGVAPGVHFPIVRFGKRRVGIERNNPIVPILRDAGYKIEDSVYNQNQVNIIFPITSNGARSAKSVSIFEKFQLAALSQRYYSDNSVSFTGNFSVERESEDVERVLASYANQIKSASMLPYFENGTPYKQMPFEEIEEAEYLEMLTHVQKVDWSPFFEDQTQTDLSSTVVSGCTNDSCTVNF